MCGCGVPVVAPRSSCGRPAVFPRSWSRQRPHVFVPAANGDVALPFIIVTIIPTITIVTTIVIIIKIVNMCYYYKMQAVISCFLKTSRF